jgi:hypothetical protein
VKTDVAHAAAGRLWGMILAAPLIGYSYFWVVYLLAEAECADDLSLFGTTTLRVVIVVSTLAAVAATVVLARSADRLWRGPGRAAAADVAEDNLVARADEDRRFVGSIALITSGLFVLFVLMVGAPVIGSSLC